MRAVVGGDTVSCAQTHTGQRYIRLHWSPQFPAAATLGQHCEAPHLLTNYPSLHRCTLPLSQPLALRVMGLLKDLQFIYNRVSIFIF